jgi:hypothetical protein
MLWNAASESDDDIERNDPDPYDSLINPIASFRYSFRELRELDPHNGRLFQIRAPGWEPNQADAALMRDALENARQDVAHDIAEGHAFEEHADMVFGVSTRVEFELKIYRILSRPEEKLNMRAGGATAYFRGGVTVIVNHTGGEGTVVRESLSEFHTRGTPF